MVYVTEYFGAKVFHFRLENRSMAEEKNGIMYIHR